MQSLHRPKLVKIDKSLFDQVQKKAEDSPRKRSNHNFHELHEVYQRFLNVLQKGTYIRPHKHSKPRKPETFLSLEGEFGFLTFDDLGNTIDCVHVSNKGPVYGVDILPDVWHSVVCLTDVCVCFEGKSGPYDPTSDKEFASWAPDESDEARFAQMEKWTKLFPQL